MIGRRLPLALREYLSFIRYEGQFGPRVVLKDMIGLVRLAGQEKMFEQILTFSEETGWKFTLFFTARNLERHEEWLEHFLDQGHEIASHSYSHILLPAMSDTELREEFTKAEECFDEYGIKPLGLRPPFLATDERVPELAKEFGFEYLSSQHGGNPFAYESGIREFPVTKPYDWYGRVVMRKKPYQIGDLWEEEDGVVTLVHLRYFRMMKPYILRHHTTYRNDLRVCSLLKRRWGKGYSRWSTLSFDIY